MQIRSLRVALFLRAGPLHHATRYERLTIYAAAPDARHFLACCIKPVTGLIVSSRLLLLWTLPFRPGESG